MAIEDLKNKLNNPKGQEIWDQLSRNDKIQVIKQYVPDYGNYKVKDRFEFIDFLDDYTKFNGQIRSDAKTGGAIPISGPITDALVGGAVTESPILKPVSEAVGDVAGSFASKVKNALGGTSGAEAEENLVNNVLAKRGLKDLAPEHPENPESLKSIGEWANKKIEELNKIPSEGRKFLAEPEEEYLPNQMTLEKSQKILSGTDDLLKNNVNPNSATGKLLTKVANTAREYQAKVDPELGAAREATRVGYQEVDPTRSALLKVLSTAKDYAVKGGATAIGAGGTYGLLKKLGVL